MFEIPKLLILIPAMPLVAAVFTALLGPRVLRDRSHWPVILAIGASCLGSLLLLFQVQEGIDRAGDHRDGIGYEQIVRLWSWANVDGAYPFPSPLQEGRSEGDRRAGLLRETDSPALSQRATETSSFHIEVVLRADPLTAVMLATVTLISLLVAVYSVGYMQGDRGYWRFFTYIALFVFAMTMLVSVSNFVLLYVFWEAVGLCSYLLIGFWYDKPSAAAAGMKAFLVNRVGDFGFALGVFLLWTTFGTLDFHDTVITNGSVRVVQSVGLFGETMLAGHPGSYLTHGAGVVTAACLLLLWGACGKSAQFPLHVWLPDAMEGPTPVSALIHAATMVTAGVYLIARCTPLFAVSVTAQQAVAAIGGFTALLAAVIALTQTDLKRILAYSTISQLGYMFLGLGTGTLLGATAGMFHLVTHAFFKALLFLGAGSVMHAMGGVIDIRRFGGLRRVMPWTHATFLVGCLALAGVFPFAGFWSKDLILVAGGEKPHVLYQGLGLIALLTAFLTAFYIFRAFFLTFYGEVQTPREAGRHAHESPRSMVGPLIVLAAGSLVVGAYFELTHGFAHFLRETPSLAVESLPEHGVAAADVSHLTVAVLSTAIALAGIGLAWFLYLGREGVVRRLAQAIDLLGLYRLSHGKFFFDQIYNALVVWPLEGLARLCDWIDRHVIDAVVNACGQVPVILGATVRSLQVGLIQFYALAMVLGLLVLIGALMWM